MHLVGLLLLVLALTGAFAVAGTHVIDATTTQPSVPEHHFELGTLRRPDGREIGVTSTSLLLNGKPWLPVMGEFHYARYPANEWRAELLKMKAGGIDIVATYVFWIHHEEIETEWDWTGRRSLRDFVKLCAELDLPIVVRCGPWCHGEVRNGGLPDWVAKMGRRARTDDPEYLAKARLLYRQIAQQLSGLLWKDNGPVIGIQLDNEYWGPAEHLLTLKAIAREVGLDVPIYTRTGWPNLRTPMPFGQVLPLYGGYAEGFWDRVITPMPGKYWRAFTFTSLRTDVNIAAEQLGEREARDAADAQQYPYLTCELSGGMPSSYHRRIKIDPRDVSTIALVKLGSGSNLPGYYMFHGGTNPQGKLTTLNESQASNEYNDLPPMTYDFQAPLGEFGQVRPHYHLLRRLHLFLHDWGEQLTSMRAMFPAQRHRDGADATTLRWSVRTDGSRGFVFVNNYQRLLPMPAKRDVQFEIKLKSASLRVPEEPFTIPADLSFFWPFNLDLGGARLIYATARPVCRIEHGDAQYVIFAQTPGVASEFVLDASGITIDRPAGTTKARDGRIRLSDVSPGIGSAIRIRTADGKRIEIVLLDDATSLNCWKIGSRVLLTAANVTCDGNVIRLRSSDPNAFTHSVLPGPAVTLPAPQVALVSAKVDQAAAPSPTRESRIGSHRVAEQPTDADFEKAGVWRIALPADIDPSRDLLLRIRYTGDVAQIYLDDKLLTDNFYNGDAFEVGLKRYAPEIYRKPLVLKVLPMPADAPIYLSHAPRPQGATVEGVDLVETFEQLVELPPAP